MNIRLLVEEDTKTLRSSVVFPGLPECANAEDTEKEPFPTPLILRAF